MFWILLSLFWKTNGILPLFPYFCWWNSFLCVLHLFISLWGFYILKFFKLLDNIVKQNRGPTIAQVKEIENIILKVPHVDIFFLQAWRKLTEIYGSEKKSLEIQSILFWQSGIINAVGALALVNDEARKRVSGLNETAKDMVRYMGLPN